jgi:hypothetical protein
MQPASEAPSGATCARHPGVEAPLVCGRCGSFMCGGCAEAGGQSVCPACRALVGTDGFPFRRDDFDLGRLWGHALACFQRDWLLLTVGVIVFLAFVFAGSLVASALTGVALHLAGVSAQSVGKLQFAVISGVTNQAVGGVVGIPLQAIALVGLHRLILDSLLGRRVDLGRMFSQLRKAPTFMVTQLVLLLSVQAPSMAYFGAVGVRALRVAGLSWEDLRTMTERDLLRVYITLPWGLLAGAFALWFAVFALVLLPVTLFVAPEIAVSDAGPTEVLRRAWGLGRGLRLRCLGYGLVVGLLCVVGAVLCLVPVLPALALGLCLLNALFLAARNGSGLPAAAHG